MKKISEFSITNSNPAVFHLPYLETAHVTDN